MPDKDKKDITIDWESIWGNLKNNSKLFTIKQIDNKNTISVSCPTRFSFTGDFSIEIKASFTESSIDLDLLLFNDNVTLNDIKYANKIPLDREDTFKLLAISLVSYEIDNRIVDRFTINSSGFKTDKEAENALVDYINNKATENGRMFDDKIDELYDTLVSKKENYKHTLESIRSNRSTILKKVETFLKYNFGWKSPKSEDYSDSAMSCYDANGNLMAVVTIVDDCILVDLAKGITSKISMIQSDEDIESELVDDVSNAQQVLADRELNQLKDTVANNIVPNANDPIDSEQKYIESLKRRVTKLENLLIHNKIKRF